MTRAGAHRLFLRLRKRFAQRFPVGDVRLVVVDRHYLPRSGYRDFGWYIPDERTVYVVERLLEQPEGRVAGILAHELGHAADEHSDRRGAERRADRLAFEALGQPVLYDERDVQNLDRGRAPRPQYLHQ